MAEECASKSSCSRGSCEGCPSKAAEAAGVRNTSFLVESNKYSDIKHVIGVVSGKGGVGKSFVTATLAGLMAKAGYSVGILDADITGPSIPKMFGVTGPALGNEDGYFPVHAADGTAIMSINLLLEDEGQSVAWRGPVISGVVKQFYTDVQWGSLDYLFVDMPPGTGDVALTVFQSLPLDGIIVVTSPQDLVRMIVHKAFDLADKMHIPVLGIVENYSYVECPDCGKHIEVFGTSHIDEIAAELNTTVLGKMPLKAELAGFADSGTIYEFENTYLSDAVAVLEKVVSFEK